MAMDPDEPGAVDRDDMDLVDERSEEPDIDSIARRAYERYRLRGEEHGHDQEDWYEAERELRSERRASVERQKP